ncbi:MAG: Asp-tRNA(Asn)/Glu-tRNA(Gln) amidotransferase subunit GatB [Lachnospiraceae bacterium]|nr:Asp-tRNA(Asn)/Glu-tRNA(Gln) amidotransferase subunit GatB [Lachnospiraceae bacterium]
MDYEAIIGLETHVELATKSKIFCGCSTAFGAEPNTQCCEICTGAPGSLPILNKEVVRFAVMAGLALNCEINKRCHMDRKNYFYPDLPKAYQISQAGEPVCINGFLTLDSGRKIGIERIHIEEDAGKLVHDNGSTFVDYNRAGVPLIEIVSKPDLGTAEEAAEYATKLCLIMRNIGISDCRLQEGSMRCDVNISLHEEGKPYGIRTEIKNINSFSNIAKAIDKEIKRQEGILCSGESVKQATLRYDAGKDTVYIMRLKENSDDYRYFPEPDIPGFIIPFGLVKECKKNLPELPDARRERYLALGLTKETAGQLYRYKKISDFFDETLKNGVSAKNSANLMIKGIFSFLKTEEEKETFDVKITPMQFAELVKYVDERKLNINRGAEILGKMMANGEGVSSYIIIGETEGVSEEDLEALAKEAIEANPKACEDIRKGKKQAINVLFGYIMKKTRGKADTKLAEEIINKLL